MTEFDVGLIVAAWLTGLAGGSGHCIGMCGGIVGALGIGKDWRGTPTLLAAHLGRVTGYALAGALAGAFGGVLAGELFGASGIAAMRVAAALLIVLIGLQLLLGRPMLATVERVGARFWRVLAPSFGRLLPPRSPLDGFAVGVLWGWLPCGLVYAELAVATTSGGALQGVLLMSAFGLGTSVSLSLFSVLLQSLGMARLPRQASGALLILFAVWTALPALKSTAPMLH